MDIGSFHFFEKDVKSIGFFGLGKSNAALLKLPEFNGRRIILRSDTPIDRNHIPKGIEVEKIYEGKDALRDIEEPILLLSPSVRRDRYELEAAKERGVLLTSDCEMFLERVEKPLFTVTGSDGKSTSVSLVGELLKEHFGNVRVCGNIGEPMLPHLWDSEAYAAELSSFQLMYAKPRSRRAGITNITENHLNWHKDFEEYKAAKLSLLEAAEEYVISADDEVLQDSFAGHGAFAVTSLQKCYAELKRLYHAECFYTAEGGYICRNGKALFPVADIRRQEKHNIKNLLFALAMCDEYVSAEYAGKVASRFSGLAHRCEYFLSHGGVDFIDSSIDTTPARTAATLQSLGRRVVIILGGRGKGLSFEPIVPMLRRYVKYAVITGECQREIFDAAKTATHAEAVQSFDEAVRRAIEVSEGGDAVLLSPAATSYDSFENFEARGNHFKKIVFEHCKSKKKE